jgi:Tfp pilus assembly protein FimT
MLIVLAVVVAVASLGWPSLRKLSHKSTLRDAARQLRVALARTRLEAIESGEVRFLRYQPGTGVFEVSGSQPVEDRSAVAQLPTEAAADGTRSPAIGLAPGDGGQHELSEGVYFLDAALPDAVASPSDVPALDGSAQWSQPIVFFPNGRTTSALIRLECQGKYYVDVALRGLTGTVKVGTVERLDTSLEQTTPQPSSGSL